MCHRATASHNPCAYPTYVVKAPTSPSPPLGSTLPYSIAGRKKHFFQAITIDSTCRLIDSFQSRGSRSLTALVTRDCTFCDWSAQPTPSIIYFKNTIFKYLYVDQGLLNTLDVDTIGTGSPWRLYGIPSSCPSILASGNHDTTFLGICSASPRNANTHLPTSTCLSTLDKTQPSAQCRLSIHHSPHTRFHLTSASKPVAFSARIGTLKNMENASGENTSPLAHSQLYIKYVVRVLTSAKGL